MQKINKNHLKALTATHIIRAVAVLAFIPMVSHCGKRHDTHFVANETGDSLEIIAGDSPFSVDQNNMYSTDPLLDRVVASQDGDETANVPKPSES